MLPLDINQEIGTLNRERVSGVMFKKEAITLCGILLKSELYSR